MNTTTKTLAALSAFAFFAGSAQAATIYSEDFEGTGISGAGFTGNDWTGTAFSETTALSSNIVGSNYTNASVGNAWGVIHSQGGVSADTGQVIADNTTYTLSFDQINRNDVAVEGLTVELFRVDNGATLASGAFAAPAGDSAPQSIGFTTSGGGEVGQNIGIRFIDTTNNANPPQAGVDNIVLDATLIPEPTSLSLLGLGGLLIAHRRRG